MATPDECEAALHRLADRIATNGDDSTGFDRTLTCTVRDLDLVFAGRLRDGTLSDIRSVHSPDAQIRLSMTSEDLLRLVDGDLNLASAWATGRVKIQAGVRDMIKMRSLF